MSYRQLTTDKEVPRRNKMMKVQLAFAKGVFPVAFGEVRKVVSWHVFWVGPTTRAFLRSTKCLDSTPNTISLTLKTDML